MERGIVKRYNVLYFQEEGKKGGYGSIISKNGEDIFFHHDRAKGPLRVLLQNNLAINEPVLFETKPSEKKPGKLEATQVYLDKSLRKVGYVGVRKGGNDQDVFFIKDYDSEDTYYLDYANIRKKDTDKFVRLDENDPVLFTPESNELGLVAYDVVLVDTRQFIQNFAEFQDYNKAIEELGGGDLCEKENWDYIQKKTGGYPILWSYINQTCKRLVFQNKIVEGTSKTGKTYACFNTGLVDRYQSEIFAYFKKNPKYKDNQPWGIQIPKWIFLEFNTDQSSYSKYFETVPEIATYFDESDISKLIFDTRVKIVPSWEHLNKRRKRVNSTAIQNMSEDEFRDAIEDSKTMAIKRIKRNYKTAIPHFYNGDIQFLVPLCERKDRGKALAAMVIQKIEQIYEITTILTLDQAYNNARLLAKPDREWLNP